MYTKYNEIAYISRTKKSEEYNEELHFENFPVETVE